MLAHFRLSGVILVVLLCFSFLSRKRQASQSAAVLQARRGRDP